MQFNVDAVSVTKTSGTISLGFPNLNINPTPLPLTTNPITELAPLTPYPKNIPTLDSNTSLNGNINSTINTDDYNNNYINPNTYNNSYTNPNNNYNNNANYMNSNNYNNTNLEYPSEQDDNFLHSYNESKVNERYLENPITELAPLTPYPKNIPTLDSNTSLNGNINSTTNSNDYNNNYNNNENYMNSNNYNNINLEYPSEQDDNFLHSYNETKVNERYSDDSVNILDILRNFDISVDFSSDEFRKNNCTEDEVDELFAVIEKDSPGILATMKTYRIPYPIAKLLIKKIIQISLDNCKR